NRRTDKSLCGRQDGHWYPCDANERHASQQDAGPPAVHAERPEHAIEPVAMKERKRNEPGGGDRLERRHRGGPRGYNKAAAASQRLSEGSGPPGRPQIWKERGFR